MAVLLLAEETHAVITSTVGFISFSNAVRPKMNLRGPNLCLFIFRIRKEKSG